MNRYRLILLSVTGGVLSGFAWSEWCPGIILLFSLVPFFLIENHIFRNPERFTSNAVFLLVLPGIVLFNMLTTGWIRSTSIPAAITVIMGMSFIMSFTIWLSHKIRVIAGTIPGVIAAISLWMVFEYFTQIVEIITPWANLGNGLAKDISLIQWYEATGVAGGTLWILTSNLLLAIVILKFPKRGFSRFNYIYIWILVIILPISISFILLGKPIESGGRPSEVVILQPNIDPFTEKFNIPFPDQMEKVRSMAASHINSSTDWVITPETTIDDPFNESETGFNLYISSFRSLTAENPGTTVVAGMVTRINDKHYNSALRIDSSMTIEIYHKSKLVPGIEKELTPILRIFSKVLPSLGGTSWGYGSQKERELFTSQPTGEKAAPVICYESVFGGFVAEYVRNGANYLFIITNDGWWKNTAGYMHHLNYASLRAIETRRWIARSANTGISCIIDPKGRRIIETEWWEEDVLIGNIYPSDIKTIYTRYGNYLYIIGLITSSLLLFYTLFLKIRRK